MNIDATQYVRLLAEISAIGLTENQYKDLGKSMDLPQKYIKRILEKADLDFEAIKVGLLNVRKFSVNGALDKAPELYYSDRGHVLVGSRHLECDIVTVEVYEKWYTPYIIHSDGSVTKADFTQAPDDIPFLDHYIHPDLLRWIAKSRSEAGHETEACPLAIELTAGRWAIEVNYLFINSKYE